MAISADLMVLALVRRQLIAAGIDIEDVDDASRIEAWIRFPVAAFGGQSLLDQYIQGGVDALTAAVAEALQGSRSPGDHGSPAT